MAARLATLRRVDPRQADDLAPLLAAHAGHLQRAERRTLEGALDCATADLVAGRLTVVDTAHLTTALPKQLGDTPINARAVRARVEAYVETLERLCRPEKFGIMHVVAPADCTPADLPRRPVFRLDNTSAWLVLTAGPDGTGIAVDEVDAIAATATPAPDIRLDLAAASRDGAPAPDDAADRPDREGDIIEGGAGDEAFTDGPGDDILPGGTGDDGAPGVADADPLTPDIVGEWLAIDPDLLATDRELLDLARNVARASVDSAVDIKDIKRRLKEFENRTVGPDGAIDEARSKLLRQLRRAVHVVKEVPHRLAQNVTPETLERLGALRARIEAGQLDAAAKDEIAREILALVPGLGLAVSGVESAEAADALIAALGEGELRKALLAGGAAALAPSDALPGARLIKRLGRAAADKLSDIVRLTYLAPPRPALAGTGRADAPFVEMGGRSKRRGGGGQPSGDKKLGRKRSDRKKAKPRVTAGARWKKLRRAQRNMPKRRRRLQLDVRNCNIAKREKL